MRAVGSTGCRAKRLNDGERISGLNPMSSWHPSFARWGMSKTRERCSSSRNACSVVRGARAHQTRYCGRYCSFRTVVLAVTVAYGRQPLLAFVWLCLFWGLGVAVYSNAERLGALKPNNAVVLRSPEWTLCGVDRSEQRFLSVTQQLANGRAEAGQTQLACFREQWEVSSYPEFNAWMYSLGHAPACNRNRAEGVLAARPSQTRRDSGDQLLLLPIGDRMGIEPTGNRRILGSGEVGMSMREQPCSSYSSLAPGLQL